MRCLPAGVLAVLALAALAAPRVTLAQVGPQSAKETWDIFFKSVGARQRIDKLAQQMGVSAERLLGGPLNKFQSLLNPPWLSPALQRKVNRAMDDSYEKVIEILRQLVETMAEPLKIEKILLDRNDPLVQVKGYLKDVSIEQLSTFDVKDLEINLYNVSAAIKVDFEKIDAHGKYDVDGTASGQLHVFGQGDFHIRMYQPAIEVDIQLDYDSEHFKISTLNVYVRMAKLKLILENFLGGGEVGDLVCGIASDVGPAALDEYREEVNHLISSNIVETANALLATVPIDKIIDWITGGGAGDQSEQRAGH